MFKWTLINNDTEQVEVLEKDPRGWEDAVLKHERGEKWHGIFYDFANEFKFYCKGGGKEFVDAGYESKGQESNMSLTLDVKCNGIPTRLFTGKLNFSNYRQEWIAGKLYSILDVEKDDIKKLLNVREDLKVDLLQSQSLSGVPLNTYPFLGYDITMHSKVVHIESEWESESHGCCLHLVTSGIKLLNIVPETTLINGDFMQSERSESLCFSTAPPIVNTANNPVFVQPQTVRVTWDIAGTCTFTTFDVTPVPSVCAEDECGTGALFNALFDSIDVSLRVFYGNGDSTADATEGADCGANPINEDGVKFFELVEFGGVSTGNPDVFPFSGSGTRDIILNPGDKIWYQWVVDFNLNNPCDMRIEFAYSESQLKIESDTSFRNTTCTAIAIHEAWSRLAERITDQKTAFYSEFFGRTDSNIVYASNGCGSKTALTSGLNIRGIEASITTTLKDMFDACNAVWAIGIGIEKYNGFDIVRAEPVYYFYQDTVVLTLENVPNIQMNHVPDMVYNQVMLGFRKWETQNVNGLDEPLTKIEYAIPDIKQSKNAYESLSPFVAGMYAIELTRRVVENTKDTTYDEDIFFICLNNDDLTIPEKDENFQSITGLLSPETAYNLRFLLSSTFDRVKYQFTAGLTKLGTMADPVLMPAEGEGNEDVTYAFIPDGCDGDHFGSQQSNGRAGRYPHAQARRENPLWLPEEFTFEYPLSFTDYLTLIANPYGLIRFSDGQDNFYSGWLLSLEYNVRQKSGAFRIIRKYG